MSTDQPAVSVIIRTLAEACRRDLIGRAIRSILSQEGIRTIPIIVANGRRFDSTLIDELKARDDLRFHYLEEGSLPEAMRRGVAMVETQFFCFLDDDDEFLPHAMRVRTEAMLKDTAVDAVVGNGIRHLAGRQVSSGGTAEARRDPLSAMVDNNWLAPCGAQFRTSRFPPDYFDVPKYDEWTYLAYKLCLTRKIEFLDNPSYIMHDTEGSVTKSKDYRLDQTIVMERLLALDLPENIRRLLRAKYGLALHDLVGYYLESRNFSAAWRCHLRSLFKPRGLRFALYTRKLLGIR